MTVKIVDGWLVGSLPDDSGREWPVVQHRQISARGPLKAGVHNLVLHTTETSGYVEQLKFPSQWQCGEGKIGQHIRLGLAGDSVNNWDLVAQQIEMVGRSQVGRWLPEEQTLGPTVALVAWLHTEELIKTGLKRPKLWPIEADTPPGSTFPATSTYYRRKAGVWPDTPGVYGHIEIPDNSHWDPGGVDYPRFFARVQAVVEGGDDMATAEDIQDGSKAGREAPLDDPPPPARSGIWKWAYNEAQRIRKAALTPQPGDPGAHTHPLVSHEHSLEGKAK